MISCSKWYFWKYQHIYSKEQNNNNNNNITTNELLTRGSAVTMSSEVDPPAAWIWLEYHTPAINISLKETHKQLGY